MRNFKNNYRRNRYKNHSDRNHHKNGNGSKIINDLQNGSDFVRKSPGRNNHNASKLIEKYNNLAREALSIGDKILSENYFQHADHFTRIQVENDNYKKNKLSQNDDKNLVSTEEVSKISRDNDKKDNFSENDNIKADKILSEAN